MQNATRSSRIPELVRIRYENIRGFYDATLPLDRNKTLIVGRNNAGKTSAIMLLAWLINDANPQRLFDSEPLTRDERSLLLPARSAKHRARRISLTVHFRSRRYAKKFLADKHKNVLLRVGFRVSGEPYVFLQLGTARRDSGAESQSNARELLELLQETYSVLHIPSARDANSVQFASRFRNLYNNVLTERALHSGRQSGSTTEYRQILKTTSSLRDLSENLLRPVIEKIADSLPVGLLESPNLTFREGIEESIVNWMLDQLTLTLITGEHDDIGVEPPNVGAGLQSVLDIAAASVILQEDSQMQRRKQFVIAVEEPEAFLHPSLQRVVARQLLSGDYGDKTIISTHSSVLVEEAQYADILLAVDRTLLQPVEEEDLRRAEIHTALMSGQGAEMMFSRSVLLVEGEGDRAFFEGIRRKLARADLTGTLDNLFVLQVGGKTSFGPWIRFLHALNGGSSGGAFRYLVVPDGDAVGQARTAFNQGGISLPREAIQRFSDATRNLSDGNYREWRQGLRAGNALLENADPPVPLCFLEGDLEWAMFSNVSKERCEELAISLGVQFNGKRSFVKKMGSKALDGKARNGNKSPYMRKQVAERLDVVELSEGVRNIVRRWLINGGLSPEQTEILVPKEAC